MGGPQMRAPCLPSPTDSAGRPAFALRTGIFSVVFRPPVSVTIVLWAGGAFSKILQPANRDAAGGVVAVVAKVAGVLDQARRAWPVVSIHLWDGSGFCRDHPLVRCEARVCWPTFATAR